MRRMRRPRRLGVTWRIWREKKGTGRKRRGKRSWRTGWKGN
jgi:hypothetical protein